MSNANTVYYIIYIRGKARLVSKEEWERSWLNWYKKNKK